MKKIKIIEILWLFTTVVILAFFFSLNGEKLLNKQITGLLSLLFIAVSVIISKLKSKETMKRTLTFFVLFFSLFLLNSCNQQSSYEEAVIKKQQLDGNDKIGNMFLMVKAEEELHGNKIVNDFNDFDYLNNHYHFFIQYDDLGSGGVFFFKNASQITAKEYIKSFFTEKGYVLNHYGPQTFDMRYRLSDGKTEVFYYENRGKAGMKIYPYKKGGLYIERIDFNL